MSIINPMCIVKALAEISTHENLRITINESAKGALIVGSFAFVGGLVGGPVGLGIGGVIGAVTGAYKGKGKYKSVADVLIYDMTPEQRSRLAYSLTKAFRRIGLTDILLTLSMAMNNESLRMVALDVLKQFLAAEGFSLV